MAGVKITGLPVLSTAPEIGDKLVVVDVSDTSEAATGTTKQMDVDLLGIPVIDPNTALLIEVTRAEIIGLFPSFDINPKACYRITDSAAGIIRVWGKSATELTATAMLEGTDNGAGTVTNGQWGNYDLDGDVFTPTATSGTWTPVASSISVDGSVTFHNAYYQRVGNIISCAIIFDEITFPDGGALNFSVSLPVSTTFANANQLAASSIKNLELNEESYSSQSAGNKMDVSLTNGSGTASTITGFQINFTYPVI